MTDVEEGIVRHPLFQRLRYISQNSSAFYTYPSNRHDRFLHSLGVMKIGGDIFLNATENCFDEDVCKFMRESYRFIKQKASVLNSTIRSIATQFFETQDLTFVKYGLSFSNDWEQTKNELNSETSNSAFRLTRAILFQSLRIACLLHDVGHFPYSHTIEGAIANYISMLQEKRGANEDLAEAELDFLDRYSDMKKYLNLETDYKDLHEMIGIKLLDEILPASDLSDFHRLCRTIARGILTKEEHDSIVPTLYRIVSGELDADRLDYSLRDPYSSGLEFGKIDMDRLLNSFTLVEDENEFIILPKVQALSSIETFFHHRYLSYKYLIYHHNKVRMDKIIAKIITSLLNIHFSPNTDTRWIKNILDKNNFSFLLCKINGDIPVETEKNDYYYCDEGWLNSLVKEIYLKSKTQNESDKVSALLLMIETFIFRKTVNVVSLFKRYDSYIDFFEKALDKVKQQKQIPPSQQDFIKDCIGLVVDGTLEEFKEKVWEEHKLIFLIKMTPTKSISFEEDGNARLKVVVGSNKKVEFVNKFSPYLDSMKFMNDTDQLFHIFLVGESVKTKQITNNVRDELQKFIIKKYMECDF